MTIYDSLNTEELLLAKKPITLEEEICADIARTYYNSYRGFIKDRIFHKINLGFAKHTFEKNQIGFLSKIFSDKTTGCYSLMRFYHLYRLIKKIKPQTVFEFGSGASTVFISECLKLNQNKYDVKGKVVSFEQSEKWYKLLIENFPDELQKYAELNLTPLRMQYFQNKYRGLYYEFNSYPNDIDLVYIDGPTCTRGNKESEDAMQFWFCADIVKMVNSGVNIRYAVTDKRFVNFMFYKQLLNEHSIRFSPYQRSIIIKKNS